MQPRTQKQQYWQDHIDQWRASGLTQAEYCRRHEVNIKQFYNNKSQLENGLNYKAENLGQFYPIALTPNVTPNAQAVSIEVSVIGAKIQFSHETDEVLFAKLVSCLRKAS